MLHHCDNCPGRTPIYDYLAQSFQEAGHDTENNIRHTTWLQTDRSEVVTKECTIKGFCLELCEKLDKLTEHHYIAKHQAKALRMQKETLSHDEVIVIGDFAENCSFLVQDAVQGWHWVNSQATLHPFCVYYIDTNTNKTDNHSLCIISDHMTHDTSAVYAFQRVVIRFIKHNHANVTAVKYFTDGRAAQYKNFKNLANICHHEDFSLQCEWNFFATSHGKGPCYGIGGVVKRLATRYSKRLVKLGKDMLLNSEQLYHYAKESINGTNVFYVSTADVSTQKEFLSSRFENFQRVPDCRDMHSFAP